MATRSRYAIPLLFDFAAASPQITMYYPYSLAKAGIEDLKVDLQGKGGAGIQVDSCDSCWIKGVDVGNGGNYMLMIMSSVNLEVRDSYIHDGGNGPNHSGICFLSDYRYGGSSSAKVENNIISNAFPNIEINNNTSGLFIGYNYSPGSNGSGAGIVTWNLDDNHAPFPVMNLYEGNVADQFGSDGYFGGSGYATALRNHISGYNPNVNAKGNAIVLKRLTYNYNLVGNVLGSAQQAPNGYANGCVTGPTIYELGYPNIGNCDTVPYDGFMVAGGYPDAKVTSSLLRWGNYDYFHRSAQFNCSEMPAGVACPTTQLIPKSYAYAQAPSWWPAAVAFPPIGPDVTGGNGDAEGHANKIPAQLCYEKLNLKGGGAFNAASCAQPSITPTPTPVPTPLPTPIPTPVPTPVPTPKPSPSATPTPPPAATASLVANPAVITAGKSSILTWTSTNANACTGLGFSTGGSVSGSVTVSPQATTTYTVTCGSASASAKVTVNAVVSGGESLFGSKTGPSFTQDGTRYELGTIFSPTVNGQVTAIRVYLASGESGEHTARIWSNRTGQVIAGPYKFTVRGSGWFEFPLPAPVALRGGSRYTVSVSTGADASHAYVAIPYGLTAAGTNGQHLKYPANAGVFSTTLGARPRSTYNSNNYLRDIVFKP